MNNLVIVGASGHGKVIADIAEKVGYTDIVFLDDNPKVESCGIYKVVGGCKSALSYKNADFIVAIGNTKVRRKIQSELIEMGLHIISLIHPASVHDYSLFSPLGVHLELHFSLIQEDCLEKANLILKTAWDYTVNDPHLQYCRELTNEMFIFYHIAHMAKHFIKGGCGIRPFIDLWIMKRKMSFDSLVLEKLLSDAQLFNFYTAVYEVVGVWFENNPHNNVTESIEEFILKGGVYGNINNAAAITAAIGESRLRSFSKLMFIPRKSLEILYPKLEHYPILFPYYQAKRWFRIFNKNKRNKIKHITDIRNSVTKAEISSTVDLLDHLGLNEKA